MHIKSVLAVMLVSSLSLAKADAAPSSADGSILPFQPTPSASKAAARL
jgi:hypothetical protein